VAFRPAAAKERFDTHHFASGETTRSIFEWVESLTKTQYKVEITNNANEDLENLTVFFHVNQYLNGQIILTGPFSKSLQALPPGQSAGFDLCPCLYMASDYDVAFKFLGEQHYDSFNVDALNNKEKAAWGAIEFCVDALEIFLQ
jgi:hypothetical protein